MAESDFKTMIENARNIKGYSQRELAKRIGLSQSTYNDTINGKIKKPDIEILKKIAEELDLSLDLMLKESGYGEAFKFYGLDKYQDKSTKDLKEMIEEYQKAVLDLMDFDFHKRETARKARESLFFIIEHLQIMQENPDSKYTVKMAIEALQNNFESLAKVEEKYDYKKLPKDM